LPVPWYLDPVIDDRDVWVPCQHRSHEFPTPLPRKLTNLGFRLVDARIIPIPCLIVGAVHLRVGRDAIHPQKFCGAGNAANRREHDLTPAVSVVPDLQWCAQIVIVRQVEAEVDSEATSVTALREMIVPERA